MSRFSLMQNLKGKLKKKILLFLLPLLPGVLIIILVMAMLIAVVGSIDQKSFDSVLLTGSSNEETNALHVASVLYAYGYSSEMVAAILGNIEEESGSIDFTSMEVYSGARDPLGINGGLNYGEAFAIGPMKQAVIADGLMGYTTDKRDTAAEHYRGGGYFGFSYGNAIGLYDFCQNFDRDGDGEPEGYVWWQMPEDTDIPSGGDLQMIYFIKTAGTSLNRFENFERQCFIPHSKAEDRIRQYTYAFLLAYELNVPIPIQLGSNLENYSGPWVNSSPWRSRDNRVTHAMKWYQFLEDRDGEIAESYGEEILEAAGIGAGD